MYSIANKRNIGSLTATLFSPARVFMLSSMVVNGGNYLYNIMLGRWLGPGEFAVAGLLITLLLVFSFLGMTFQITTTKFKAELPETERSPSVHWLSKIAIYSGILCASLLILFSVPLSKFFHMNGILSLCSFALCLPLYFSMSVSRGSLQASEHFYMLSGSYLAEMVARILTTIVLVLSLNITGVSISFSILLSVCAGLLFTHLGRLPKPTLVYTLSPALRRGILTFFSVTAGYEVVQIMINYGDMLLVKHYFDQTMAGLYTSMALVGRMIYFITWMVVMIMVPGILNKRKRGEAFLGTFYQYVAYISAFCVGTTAASYLFPEVAVTLLFGEAYLPIAPYLWMYALATSLFALANMFIYLSLTLDKYPAVMLAAGVAVVQMALYTEFHDSFGQILLVQIISMAVLLSIQMLYFIRIRKTI
ncbi:hypothetical protein AB9P05_16360 [Roseivirga sp. BDSF3-8]|uniref:hypothetical protein n=1 Tax=Roseivirga sp. BDSF3-8 TaxID=3241598 RepID=UPI003531B29F